MVEQSLLDSEPVVSVTIQYRLGALGYLHIPEPGNANRALNDQRNALLWIQKFIGGFGGDHNRTTVFGESAGAISICSHMLSGPPPSGPLFQRAIIMSGIIGPMVAPRSIADSSEIYKKFLQKVGIEDHTEHGLSKLREMDVNQIVEATAEMSGSGTMWLSVLDEDWYGESVSTMTWEKVPELIANCTWVDGIVLGTTGFEVRNLTRLSEVLFLMNDSRVRISCPDSRILPLKLFSRA